MRVPVATFRLQFRAGTTFDDARRAVPFLRALGVDTLYASPVLAARTGSEHGYDVVDPGRLDPSLGDEAAFVKLVDELRAHDMGLLLDIVPNHMAASPEHPWWVDVLRHGRRSRYARFFDIDWEAPGMEGRVLVPVLGDPYGDVLERGELAVVDEDGERWVRYFEHRFPLAPGTADGDPGRFAGVPGDPASWDPLDELLGRQHYRLAFWRVAGREADYRRFFDIADLVGMRVEDPEVFEATHAYVASLVERGLVDGLRVDHADGMLDPQGYLERLADLTGAPYVVVEKILAVGESLPEAWPVAGTTGYEFLRTLNDVFVDERGEARLEEFYGSLAGTPDSFEDLVRSRKRMVMRELFGAETASLVRRLKALAMEDRHARDLTIDELGESLREVTACLGVYRTYVRAPEVRAEDRHVVEEAVRCARDRLPSWYAGALAFVRGVLLLEEGDPEARLDFVLRWQQLTGPVMAKGLEDTALYVYNRLVSRNDVGSDPAAPAPPVEDFHRDNRARLRRWPGSMLATSTHDTKRSEDVRARINVLSEIPDRWTEHVGRWIRWNRVRKREVGGRAVPDRNEEMLLYQTLVGAWPLVEGERRELARRVKAFMVKAAREAKVHTSWIRPDPAYEAALERFVGSILAPSNRRFREDFAGLERVVAFHGAVNGLAQVVLKVASPGVPDFYQGTAVWNLSLVDPDNRREVDLERHHDLLEELDRRDAEGDRSLLPELLEGWRDGRVKLWVTSRALRLRRDEPELFLRGDYLGLQASGRRAANVCAFARRAGGSRWAVAVVPILSTFAGEERWPVGYGVWGRTALGLPSGAPARWRNVLTGERVDASPDGSLRMAHTLRSFPVGLLVPA